MDPSKTFEPKIAAKKLMREGRSGALATLMAGTGDPYCSLVNVATAFDGSPILLISQLAIHTKNILADARVSLMLDERKEGDPLQGARVMLMGRAERTDNEDDRRRYRACPDDDPGPLRPGQARPPHGVAACRGSVGSGCRAQCRADARGDGPGHLGCGPLVGPEAGQFAPHGVESGQDACRLGIGAGPPAHPGCGGVVEQAGLKIGEQVGGDPDFIRVGIGVGPGGRAAVHRCPRWSSPLKTRLEGIRRCSLCGGAGGEVVQRFGELAAGP